jgi:hypothetical protein
MVYRTRSQAIGLAVGGILFLALMVVGSAHSSASHILIFSPIALFSVLLPIRAATTALVVDEQGVTVRNVIRTVSVLWAEIERFEVGRYKILGCVLIVCQNSGDVLPVFAIQGITGQPNRRTSVSARRLAAELNKRLQQITD